MAEKIESGALNLSQLSKAQQAIRAAQKHENRKIDTLEKRELLGKIENKTQQTTELILAQELNLPVEIIDKTKTHRDESVTLTVKLNKEQMELLKKVGDLIAHAVPEKKWAHVVTYLAQKELDRRTKRKREVANTKGEKELNKESREKNDEEKQVKSNKKHVDKNQFSHEEIHSDTIIQRKPISLGLRKSILHQHAACEFQDPLMGKRCRSKRFLQIDHIQSVWAGGTNQPENLRALCAQHNRFKYFQETGLHP